MMLTVYQINDLHHVYRCEHLPIRKIERRLRMSRRTIKKYLDAPAQGPTQRQDESRLDPCEADTLCSCSPRGGPSRALIQASRRRRPNAINATLTGTASAPTCSGSQTGAQDDVKTDENAALFARLHMLFESSERFLTEQLDYNLPWLCGRRDYDRRYCGLGWHRVRRRQAEAESQSA